MEIVPLHSHKEFTDECAAILNTEWPRSKAARLYSLEKSCDQLPICLILLSEGKVIGHSRLLLVQGIKNACLLESVIVPKELRGKGIGRILMEKTEEYAKSKGFKTMYLNTIDKQEFYQHIGFQYSQPVVSLGANAHLVPDSMISKMLGVNFGKAEESENEKASDIQDKETAELSPPDTSAPPPPPPPPPPPVLISSGSKGSTDNRHVVRLSRNSVTWMKKDL